MAESKKDKNYRDFSNRTAYNGYHLLKGEILVPAVLNDEMKDTLKEYNLNYDNAETWHLRNGKRIPVVFIPTKDTPDAITKAIKVFNIEAKRYLTGSDEWSCGDVSLDKLREDEKDEDRKGYDPTASTKNEDNAFTLLVLRDLIDDLNKLDKRMGKIIELLYDDAMKKDILQTVDLGKGKTQGYTFIGKTQKAAQKLYIDQYN